MASFTADDITIAVSIQRPLTVGSKKVPSFEIREHSLTARHNADSLPPTKLYYFLTKP